MRSLRHIGDNKFFLVLALSVGFVAVFELGWRVANGWTRHWLDCHRYHPQLGWSLRENWAGRFSWTGGYSRINGQGFAVLGEKERVGFKGKAAGRFAGGASIER